MASRMDEATYLVAGMSSDHCKASVAEGLSVVAGVEHVDVDLRLGVSRA